MLQPSSLKEPYTKDSPYLATILERKVLNLPGSSKKTYHITLDLSGSGITYEPGDAIAIFPENPPDLVQPLLRALKQTGQEEIIAPRTGEKMSLEHFFKTKANLLRIQAALLRLYPKLKDIADSKEERAAFLESHDLEDLLTKYGPPPLSMQAFITLLPPLLPRFYSIASSKLVAKETVDLLVVTFVHEIGGKKRHGLGSQFLCERAEIGKTPIPLYLQRNPIFKLPKDPSTPLIMIGPGTGVAPFRAFLMERKKRKNWLFFGERERAFDFYYEDFFLELEKENSLKLSCAFSRDQKEKIYVQDRLHEKSAEVWQWIQTGACIYICGDAHRMAKDVTAMLETIAQKEGNLSKEEAKAFFKTMRKEKRLLLDVY